jgi:hypothetical protein
VKIKGYLVVACVTAFVSWLVFSPDGETPEKGGLSPDSATGTVPPMRPKEPQPSPARVQKGIAGTADAPYYDDRSWTSAPSRPRYAPPVDPRERYSFRPLTERERERLGGDRPSAHPYAAPPLYAPETYSQPPWAGRSQPERAGSSEYPGMTGARPWYSEGYGFFPGQGPAGADTYPRQDAYPGQPRRDSEPASPWVDPSAPQWGSQAPDWRPPEERMYPSLGAPLDRKLTAR